MFCKAYKIMYPYPVRKLYDESGLLDSHCKYLYIIIFLHQQAFEEAAKRLKMDEEGRKKMVSKRTSFCPVHTFKIWKYLGLHCTELFVYVA